MQKYYRLFALFIFVTTFVKNSCNNMKNKIIEGLILIIMYISIQYILFSIFYYIKTQM